MMNGRGIALSKLSEVEIFISVLELFGLNGQIQYNL